MDIACYNWHGEFPELFKSIDMPRPDSAAAELRELCVTFAIQAGRTQPAAIIALVEDLKTYIERGKSSGTGHGLKVEDLTSENDC